MKFEKGHTISVKRLIIIAVLCFSLPFRGFAQLDGQFSHNMFNHFAVNPGFAGAEDEVSLMGLFRQQWMGFDGAPQTTVFNAHTPFKLFGAEHGVGLGIVNDEYFFNNNLELGLSYAYRFQLGNGKLGIGLRGGILNFNLKTDKFVYPVPAGGGASSGSDVSVPSEEVKETIFDMALGVFYSTENLYLGLSSTHVTNPDLKMVDWEMAEDKAHREYFATAGYNIALPKNPMFVIAPSFFLKTNGSTTQINLNANLIYNNRMWGGLSYRLDDAISVLFGFQMRDLRFGVAYDLNVFSPVGRYSSGSIEGMVNYNFSLKRDRTPTKYKSIRYL